MNIIFLDIDGVLNKINSPISDKNGVKTPDIESFCVGLVNLLAKEVGADIVLSSSWREFDTSVAMKNDSFDVRRFLRSKGLTARFNSDWHTPISKHNRGHRGLEINEWLIHHPNTEKWIALDDSPDFSIKNLVLIDPNKGIDINDVKKAKEFFAQ